MIRQYIHVCVPQAALKSSRTAHGRYKDKLTAELDVCLTWFDEKHILSQSGRKIEDFFKISTRTDLTKKERKNMPNLHGNLDERSLLNCDQKFLPAFLQKLSSERVQLDEPGEGIQEDNPFVEPHGVEEDPEVESGALLELFGVGAVDDFD